MLFCGVSFNSLYCEGNFVLSIFKGTLLCSQRLLLSTLESRVCGLILKPLRIDNPELVLVLLLSGGP